MPTLAHRLRAFFGRADHGAPGSATVTFAAPPKVIEAEPIAPYGAANGNGKPGLGAIIPTADPQKEYVAAGGGRLFSGFGYGPSGTQTLETYAAEIVRELGPQVLGAMDRDPDVSSSLDVFTSSVLEGGLQLSPAVQADPTAGSESDQPDDPEVKLAAEITDFCKRLTDRLAASFEAALHDQVRGKLLAGCKLAEITAEIAGDGPDKGKLILKSYRVKPNPAWAFVASPAMETLGYLVKLPTTYGQPETLGGAMGGYAVLPPQKCVVMAHNPRDGDPRGTSVLDAAFMAWNFKIQAWGEYGRHLMQFGSQSLVGEAAPGAQVEPPRDASGAIIPGAALVTSEQAMKTGLMGLRNGGCLGIKNGAKVYTLDPVGAGEPFLNAHEYCNRQITTVILKQNRATKEAEHGSKADSQTGQDILGLPVRVEKRATAADLKQQLYRPFVEWNFGKDAAERLTPNVSHGAVEQQDRAAMLGAYAGAGYAIDPSQLPWIDHDLGIKVREPEPAPQPEPPPADQVPGLPGLPAVSGAVAGKVPGKAADQQAAKTAA